MFQPGRHTSHERFTSIFAVTTGTRGQPDETRLAAIALILVGVERGAGHSRSQLRRVVEFAVHHPGGPGRPVRRPIGGQWNDLGQHRNGLKFGASPASSAPRPPLRAGRLDRVQRGLKRSVTWPGDHVSVTVGQTVQKGDGPRRGGLHRRAAAADIRQATLASAQAKLRRTPAAPRALTKARRDRSANRKEQLYQAVANRRPPPAERR